MSDELQPDTSSQIVRNGDSYNLDTREQLEADVRGAVHGAYAYEDYIPEDMIIGWLDRQAAITKRETLHDNPTCLGSSTCAANRPISESADRETLDTAGIGASKDEIRDSDVWSVAYEIYCAGGYVDNGNEPNPPTDGIRELLDRQAAITRNVERGMHDFILDNLEHENDKLTAERDLWLRRYQQAHDYALELTSERDQMQAAIDAMHNGQFYAMYLKACEERDHLKMVAKTQAESFKKLEAELTKARSNQAGKDG